MPVAYTSLPALPHTPPSWFAMPIPPTCQSLPSKRATVPAKPTHTTSPDPPAHTSKRSNAVSAVSLQVAPSKRSSVPWEPTATTREVLVPWMPWILASVRPGTRVHVAPS
jgi:hypothetical protein